MNKYTLKKIPLFLGLLIMIVSIPLVDQAYAQVADKEEIKVNELNGAELWAQNCGRCHNFRAPQEYNGVQWDIIVAHMRQIAGLPGAQARAISKFLREASNPPPQPLVLKSTDQAIEIKGQGDVQNGKALYENKCAACHGASGKGDGPAAVGMRPRPRDLRNEEFMQTISDKYLYEVIAYGGQKVGKSPLMPGWGNILDQKEIIDIISYMRELSEKK
jgi:mono/diheme cytochrome c family protein